MQKPERVKRICHSNVSRETRSLRPREVECRDLIIRGYRTKEIAEYMGISPRSVDAYRERIYDVTGARNAVELLRLTLRLDEPEATQ